MKSFLLLIVIFSGLSAAVSAQMPPTLVVTEAVSSMEFNDQVTLVGRTRARAFSRIVAVVPGPVMKINVAEGVPVRRGDALMTLNRQTIDFIYQAKKAEAREAEAQSDLAQQNFERAKELFAQNAIAENRLDSERAAANAAKARFEKLRAEEMNKKLDLDNCVIRTPLSGYTVRQLVDIGEWVSIGDPVFEVVDLSEIKITVDLPERHFGHLSVGSEVSVVVSGDEKNPISGVVTGIAPSASEETHTFPVYVIVKNENGRLGGGMLVRATLSLDKKFTSLAVSKDAVVRQPSGQLVYTITDGKAAPIQVQTGSTSGSMVAISGKGLEEGMSVVVRGNERIFPGAPLRTASDKPRRSGQPGQETPGGTGGTGESESHQENSSADEEGHGDS